LQGLLESLNIPYTGSGVRACSIGMDKAFQKKIMETGGFACPAVLVLEKSQWNKEVAAKIFNQAIAEIKFPMVIRPANQGSSIGVKILPEGSNLTTFTEAIDAAFFRATLHRKDWLAKTTEERITYLRDLTDIRSGLGFPIDTAGQTFYHPAKFLVFLNTYFEDKNHSELLLKSHLSEQRVIVEGFIEGKEFSCIVLKKEGGGTVSLPPTEIVKGGEVFDYRSKYLPGLSRKITPIDLPDDEIHQIRTACRSLFDYLEFNTYARIDGFITKNKEIFLNDPNTTSGMLPSSFFFHQAAEIGLNPSQFLTYIIRISLQERIEPIPVFLTGSDEKHELYQIPINLLLKDNADDIRDKIYHYKEHPVIEAIKTECANITQKYASDNVVFAPQKLTYEKLNQIADGVFIGLHGRPGEDGSVQRELDKMGLPYNGSPYASSFLIHLLPNLSMMDVVLPSN